MIFIQSQLEEKVQVDDKTRIDATKTFISPDEAAITLFEIEPEASAGFVDVTSDKYLDWSYSTAGDKTATIRVTTDGSPVTKEVTISVLSASDDKLFSNDKDIISHEVDIYRFLRPGRSTFLDFHRIAQKMILDDLDQRGLTDNQGNRLVKADIYDIEEVKEWSKYLALALIFKSVQSDVDDVYSIKSKGYMDMADRQKTRATLRLDLNADGNVDTRPDFMSSRMVRR
jgi:hypothetical protein